MSGIAALRSVLVDDAALIALVPPERIAAGVLPLNTTLPFIELSSVSVVDMNIPTPGATQFVAERVRAAVVAANDPELREVFAAMKRAGGGQLYPVVTGISGVTIFTAGAGPDIVNEQAHLYQKNMDWMVRYTETR